MSLGAEGVRAILRFTPCAPHASPAYDVLCRISSVLILCLGPRRSAQLHTLGATIQVSVQHLPGVLPNRHRRPCEGQRIQWRLPPTGVRWNNAVFLQQLLQASLFSDAFILVIMPLAIQCAAKHHRHRRLGVETQLRHIEATSF